jgi:NADH-quinone oxidoreductase subunit L
METLPLILLLILLLPLVSAALCARFLRQRGATAATLSVTSAFVCAAATLYILYHWDGSDWQQSLPWLTIGAFNVNLGFYLNPMSALLLFVVTFVGFLIHVFSLGYMADDSCRGRFFGGLSIFMFSMTGIVLADNLIMLFIFWELVGFSSYLLIGHYVLKNSASNAARKAFITNRVGDFGFLAGIIWCYTQFGTVDLVQLHEAMTHGVFVPDAVLTGIGLCLFCGVLGKSAQMPLHVWLPDAMEGPTPVSALIHAATMVAAGVYLLARTVFMYSPDALNVILWVGSITAFFAAISAFAQTDIKKILAYSTLSQLGFMVAAFGAGTLMGLNADHEHALYWGAGAALFHLMTHAFFKALMFLGSGSIIHACHHEQDIFQMGGLWKKMPLTFITFTIGVIAIAGVPFIGAGFFSKDLVLVAVHGGNALAYGLLLFTAVLTAVYMGRLWSIVFLGKADSKAASHAHESSWVMTLPLLVLAVLSVGGGYLGLYPTSLSHWLESVLPKPDHDQHSFLVLFSACASIGGLIAAWLVYRTRGTVREDALARQFPLLYRFLEKRLWFDEVYLFYVNSIQQRIAHMLGFLDMLLLFSIRGLGWCVRGTGCMARALHTTGAVGCIYWFLIGIILFWMYAFGVF